MRNVSDKQKNRHYTVRVAVRWPNVCWPQFLARAGDCDIVISPVFSRCILKEIHRYSCGFYLKLLLRNRSWPFHQPEQGAEKQGGANNGQQIEAIHRCGLYHYRSARQANSQGIRDDFRSSCETRNRERLLITRNGVSFKACRFALLEK